MPRWFLGQIVCPRWDRFRLELVSAQGVLARQTAWAKATMWSAISRGHAPVMPASRMEIAGSLIDTAGSVTRHSPRSSKVNPGTMKSSPHSRRERKHRWFFRLWNNTRRQRLQNLSSMLLSPSGSVEKIILWPLWILKALGHGRRL